MGVFFPLIAEREIRQEIFSRLGRSEQRRLHHNEFFRRKGALLGGNRVACEFAGNGDVARFRVTLIVRGRHPGRQALCVDTKRERHKQNTRYFRRRRELHSCSHRTTSASAIEISSAPNMRPV